jgi:putative methyltransferase (TIGR04325 family)
MMRNRLKNIVPPLLRRKISGLFYGWHGNYTDWDSAKAKCTGYDSELILNMVRSSAINVRDGSAAYERDSVLFDKPEYSYPLISGLMWIAAQNNGRLNVMDFGGSLGSTYYQNRYFLDSLPELNWSIIEQPGFVDVGRKEFAGDRLSFFYSVEECLKSVEIDVILLSSVLQYIEKPYSLLDKLISVNSKFILIDRTPFIKGKDRITVQKVNPRIYKASYPCWFFNETGFISYMTGSCKLIYEFEALDKANLRAQFKGFIFKKK